MHIDRDLTNQDSFFFISVEGKCGSIYLLEFSGFPDEVLFQFSMPGRVAFNILPHALPEKCSAIDS